jgi:hypothetical protein
MLALPALALVLGVADIHVLTEAEAKECAGCAAGDERLPEPGLDVVLGSSPRIDECFYSFPTADLRGSLVRFRPAGLPVSGERLAAGSPYIRVDDTTEHLRYSSVQVLPGTPRVVLARATWLGKAGQRAAVVTRYTFSGAGRVELVSSLTNSGPRPLKGLVFALFFDPHQMYDWSPSDVAGHESQSFRVYPRPQHYLAWLDGNPRQARPKLPAIWDGSLILEPPGPVDLAPGGAHTVRYTLLTAARPAALLRYLYDALGQAVTPATVTLSGNGPGPAELIVREADTGAIYFRSFLAPSGPVDLVLPAGAYTARANFFPAVVERTLLVGPGSTGRVELVDPPQGEVRLRLRDREGRPLPGKVSFFGLDGTFSPFFRTVDPVQGARYWESFKNSVFPAAEGTNVALPPGRYQVTGSHGPRDSLASAVIEVRAGGTESVELRVDAVVNAPGWIAVDPHVHSLVSDGSVDVAERVRSLVAEGVDVAIATEHNHPYDWSPTLARLGLQSQLAVIVGAEVTVPDRLDYNSYPMRIDAARPNGGAINARSVDIAGLFAQSRERDPGVVLQSNHPRGSEYDYLSWHALDENDAGSVRAGFDLSFDVLEVVNGPRLDADQNVKAKRDWLNLLRRGFFRPLVGSSDSHEIDRDEPGYSRTWVRYDGPTGSSLDTRAVVEALRHGRSFASNGPVMAFTVNGIAGPGDTIAARDGRVSVVIDVHSPAWVRVDEIRLLVNGQERVLDAQLLATGPARQLRASVELQLDRDAFLVAQASGKGSMFPVVQAAPEAGVAPYALSNPVFIDVNGNGMFDPPLPHVVERR